MSEEPRVPRREIPPGEERYPVDPPTRPTPEQTPTPDPNNPHPNPPRETPEPS